MDQGSDQLADRIAATRDDMESRIVELRRRGEEAARATGKVLLVAAGVGLVVGAVIGGVVVYRRYRRPTTLPERMAERMARILPLDEARERVLDLAHGMRSRLRSPAETAPMQRSPRWG